jgi:hypothetical protein
MAGPGHEEASSLSHTAPTRRRPPEHVYERVPRRRDIPAALVVVLTHQNHLHLAACSVLLQKMPRSRAASTRDGFVRPSIAHPSLSAYVQSLQTQPALRSCRPNPSPRARASPREPERLRAPRCCLRPSYLRLAFAPTRQDQSDVFHQQHELCWEYARGDVHLAPRAPRVLPAAA